MKPLKAEIVHRLPCTDAEMMKLPEACMMCPGRRN
jgi:hypothetical protein